MNEKGKRLNLLQLGSERRLVVLMVRFQRSQTPRFAFVIASKQLR